jgi:adenylate cyclase
MASDDRAAAGQRDFFSRLRGLIVAPERALTSLVLALLILLRAIDPAPVQRLRLNTFDFLEQLMPRKMQTFPVSIVAIDDKSLARYGQWPWSRAFLAKLVDDIAKGQPSVLGVDIIFPEPDRLSPGRLVETDPEIPREIAQQLSKLPSHEWVLANSFSKLPTVLGFAVSEESPKIPKTPRRVTTVLDPGVNPRLFLFRHRTVVDSLPEIATGERSEGSVASEPELDGIVRRVPLFIFAQGSIVPELPVEMLRVGLGAGALTIVSDASGVRGARVGSLFLPTDSRGRIYPYFSPSYEERYISAADVLDGSFDAERLKGSPVLLGSTALGVGEVRQTPLGRMSGVEVLAQALEGMMTANLLRRPPYLERIEIAILTISGLMVIFAIPYRRPSVAIVVFVNLVFVLLGLQLIGFKFSKLLIDGVYPALSSILLFGVAIGIRYRVQERARRRIQDAFGHYLSPVVVEKLSADPSSLKLGGEERIISVMFADLSGFTVASAEMPPEQLTRRVNRYFGRVVKPVEKSGGYVDSFLGDSVLAFWGAPVSDAEHAVNAVRAAFEIVDAVGQEHERDKMQGGKGFTIKVGINSGPAIVGNIGSENHYSYTAIGEDVNLAARLESVPPLYSCPIVVGEHTAKLARGVYLMRELDWVLVKGASRPMAVYQPIAEDRSASQAERNLVVASSQALEHYRSGRFADAAAIWEKLAATLDQTPSPSSVMAARARVLANEPPMGHWDAVNVLTAKLSD